MVIASYLTGALMLAGAVAVVLLRRIAQAAAALVLTFAMIAIMFLLLGADFLFAVQLFIDTVMVGLLCAAAIALTRAAPGGDSSPLNRQAIAAGIVAVAVFILLAGVLIRADWPNAPWPNLARTDDVIGGALLGQYAAAFEAFAVLILAGVAGAVLLGLPDEPRPRGTPALPVRERGRRKRRVRPPVSTEIKP